MATQVKQNVNNSIFISDNILNINYISSLIFDALPTLSQWMFSIQWQYPDKK